MPFLLYASETWRRFSRRMIRGRLSAFRFTGLAPERLVVAPVDLRIADPHIAGEIYAGRFALGGTLIETAGVSPFAIEKVPYGFANSLHRFRWLRHMRAADHDLAFANARALTDEWIAGHGRNFSGIGFEPTVLSARLIAWFSHSPVMLRGADHGFYRRFLKSLGLQVRYLRHIVSSVPAGEERLQARIALAFASLCLPSGSGTVRAAARHLDLELSRQILGDGGHLSRNPQMLVEFLTDLLPLRQTYINLGQNPPPGMAAAMDRMFSALRFFRHSNGSLALFNGASDLSADRMLAVLRYDESAGAPYREAPHSCFQRLSGGQSVVLCDTGVPPPGELSRNAHAGTLSFEFSSGGHCLVVNAGAPAHHNADYRGYARLTAAHSTLGINDRSSLSFSRSRFLGTVVTGGVHRVTVEPLDEPGILTGFVATHDGYLQSNGLIHRRTLKLMADGFDLHGEDRVERPGGADPKPGDQSVATIRFHIHPLVALTKEADGSVRLSVPDGSAWLFTASGADPEIEDDIYFADIAGARASRQIVLTFTVGSTHQVTWSFALA